MSVELIAIFSFLSVSIGTFYLLTQLAGTKEKTWDRLEQFHTAKNIILPENASFKERIILPLLHKVAKVVLSKTPKQSIEQLKVRVMMAGYPWGLSAVEFLAIKSICMVVSVILFLVGIRGEKNIILLMLSIFGLLFPEYALKNKTKVRQKQIKKSLPDVLDVLTVSVEAGLGFTSALAKVVEKQEGPIASELRRVLQDIRMGKPRKEALRELGDRTGVDDLHNFAIAVIQADQMGISIGRILRVQAQELRRNRRQRAEEAAMKAPIKMLIPLVLFIFPTLFIVLLGPAALQIIKSLSSW